MFAFIQDGSLTASNWVEQYQYHTFQPSLSFYLLRRLSGLVGSRTNWACPPLRIIHLSNDCSLPILCVGWHSDWRRQPNRNNGIWDAASVARDHHAGSRRVAHQHTSVADVEGDSAIPQVTQLWLEVMETGSVGFVGSSPTLGTAFWEAFPLNGRNWMQVNIYRAGLRTHVITMCNIQYSTNY